MNRNLDGTELTDEQLLEWALKGGASEADLRSKMSSMHNEALSRSMLISASAQARFSAFCRGELNLDTRPSV